MFGNAIASGMPGKPAPEPVRDLSLVAAARRDGAREGVYMPPRREAVENVPDDKIRAPLVGAAFRADKVEHRVEKLKLADVFLQ